MDDLEIIELNDSSWSNGKSAQKSSNFGDGIELLMNEKKKDGPTSDINIDDLTSLEQ